MFFGFQLTCGLMVCTVHGEFFAVKFAHQIMLRAYRVNGVAGLFCRHVVLRVRHILNEVAAECHVQHLVPSANAEYRLACCKKAFCKRNLVCITAVINAFARRVFLPIERRIYIGAAGDQQAVASVCVGKCHRDYRLRAASRQRRHIICKIAGVAAHKDPFHQGHSFKMKKR